MRILLLAALLTGCSPQSTRPGLPEKLDRIDALVHRAFDEGASAGLGVGVAVDGAMVYSAGLGYSDVTQGISVTDDTYWYVASTSKSLAGFGVALLAELGEVDVNAPITRYLPEIEWPEEADPEDLEVADFLGHTHGMGNGPLVVSAAFTGAFQESEWPRLLGYHDVGSRELSYSNLGYNIAGMVIDSRRPQGWKAFLREAIYEPAGLTDLHATLSGIDRDRIARPHDLTAQGTFVTLPFVKQDITMNAAGGHIGTIESLTRWAIVQMDGGRIDGRQVFPESAVANSHEILRSQDRQFAFFQRDGWGMGWDIGSYRGEPMVSRFGGFNSTRSHLSFLPRQRTGVVAMTNGPGGSIVTDIVASYVYDVMMDRADADSLADARLAAVREQVAAGPERVADFEELLRTRNRPYPRPPSDYVGSYEHPALGRITITDHEGSLRIAWGVLEGRTTVFDADSHALRHELLGGGGMVARFVVDGPGPASALETMGQRLLRVR